MKLDLRPIGSLLLLAFASTPGLAQSVSLSVAVERENFRAQPQGEVVAELLEDTPLVQVAREGAWRQATLSGWIWAPSVENQGRPGRLVVTADDGENLRAQPNGTRLARVSRGAVLTELDRQGQWVRVERTAWVWGASVSEAATPATTPVAAQPRPVGRSAGDAPPRPDSLAVRTKEWLRAGPGGNALLGTPDGDTLGRVQRETAMEVLAREGNWTRVRLEGWIWEPSAATAADSGRVLRELPPATIVASPEQFRGRIVEWQVQFIALETAERIRSDFYEGEPFMLARGPGDDATFVYVAVPPEMVEQVRQLTPLARVTILARIRTGRSRLMDAPVLDLLELRLE